MNWWWRRRKAARAMKELRGHYEEFGIPNEHLSDEEFQAMLACHAVVFREAQAAAVMGVNQAAEALQRLARDLPLGIRPQTLYPSSRLSRCGKAEPR